MEEKQQAYEFKAEIQQLLHILVHSLYTDREIFLRELISNAVDALNRLQFEMLTERDVLDPNAELAIRVEVNEEAKTIAISDSGIGMTRDEIITNLGTIAQSGAADFVRQLQEAQDTAQTVTEMIGQFGVGFYSVFMVAETVHVLSRSYRPDAPACEWVSDGSARFQVGPAEKADRGTQVIIKLKDDAHEFANDWRLEQIVKKHSDFVTFPIYFGERVVNRQKSLWRQSPHETSSEDYEDFYKHLTLDFEKPLLVSHLVADAPVDIRSVLYVPGRRDRGILNPRTDWGLKLYARGVMIQEYNKELLPQHWRFIEGVVESEDLPLNVSRETVQRNPAARRIQKALVSKLIKELETLAQEKPEDYARFWREFGVLVKEGIAADPLAKDDLLPLLRFHSSQAQEDQLVSLVGYVQGMADDQPAIYYLLADDVASAARSPHMDYFRANDIEVLYFTDPIDNFVVLSLTEFDGKPLKNVDDATLELPQKEPEGAAEPAIPEADFNRLVGRFVKVLGERVTQVRESKMLHDNPCRLLAPDRLPGREMQRVQKLLHQEFEVPKKILEINRRHPLMVNLARLVTHTPDDAVIDPTIEQVFENQLLLDGVHPNPAAMIPRLHTLLQAATARQEPASSE
ncbi:MAG: molecular chaperone HtpG [Chloroflexota bacterium]